MHRRKTEGDIEEGDPLVQHRGDDDDDSENEYSDSKTRRKKKTHNFLPQKGGPSIGERVLQFLNSGTTPTVNVDQHRQLYEQNREQFESYLRDSFLLSFQESMLNQVECVSQQCVRASLPPREMEQVLCGTEAYVGLPNLFPLFGAHHPYIERFSVELSIRVPPSQLSDSSVLEFFVVSLMDDTAWKRHENNQVYMVSFDIHELTTTVDFPIEVSLNAHHASWVVWRPPRKSVVVAQNQMYSSSVKEKPKKEKKYPSSAEEKPHAEIEMKNIENKLEKTSTLFWFQSFWQDLLSCPYPGAGNEPRVDYPIIPNVLWNVYVVGQAKTLRNYMKRIEGTPDVVLVKRDWLTYVIIETMRASILPESLADELTLCTYHHGGEYFKMRESLWNTILSIVKINTACCKFSDLKLLIRRYDEQEWSNGDHSNDNNTQLPLQELQLKMKVWITYRPLYEDTDPWRFPTYEDCFPIVRKTSSSSSNTFAT